MKLKVKQSEKNIKVLLKQFLANDVYFMYIKNINKTLIISAQINFPLLQTQQPEYYFGPPLVPPVQPTKPKDEEIESDISPNPI